MCMGAAALGMPGNKGGAGIRPGLIPGALAAQQRKASTAKKARPGGAMMAARPAPMSGM